MTEARKHKVVFLTQRGLRHQQQALKSAPSELDVTIFRDPPRDQLLPLLAQAEFLISERAGTVDADMIAAAPNLLLIQRLGIQTWDIDLAAARAAGVAVCSQPIEGCVMVAEHMLLQILGLLKRVREAMQIAAAASDWGRAPQRTDEDHFAYNWSKRSEIGMLSGATVGILGFGEVGLELAIRLRSFGCCLLYNKRSRLSGHVEDHYGLRYVAPDEIAGRCDIVCSLLPYQGPRVPLDGAFFARMKYGAYFVHCGSGAVVDEGALIAALHAGHLAGAALDTYTFEPLRPDDPLLELARDPMSNLILTPHVAGGGITAGARGRVQDYDNILALLHAQPLQHQIA
ncbi:MAG: NAD(P)-dependent oxidoreductase [Caldilineaceae bacterium]